MNNYRLTFLHWLKSESARYYVLFSGFFSLLQLAFTAIKSYLIPEGGHIPLPFSINLNADDLQLMLHSVQILFIVIVVMIPKFVHVIFGDVETIHHLEESVWKKLTYENPSPTINQEDEDQWKIEQWKQVKKDANKVMSQFIICWVACWVCWLMLYIFFFVQKEFGYSQFPSWILNAFNCINGAFFFFMFLTLMEKTTRYDFLTWFRLSFLLLLCIGADAILSHYFPELRVVFAIIAGLFTCLSMATFIGCINSRHLDVHYIILILLGLYAAIQPLYFVVETESLFSDRYGPVMSYTITLIFSLVFILKVLLFLVVTWMLQTGRLLHFMIVESSVLNGRIDRFNEFTTIPSLNTVKFPNRD